MTTRPDIQRVLAMMDAGKPIEAVAAARRLVQRSPRDPDAVGLLSNILIHHGTPEEAEFFARRTLAMFPNDHGAKANLGNVLWMRGKVGEAEALLREAMAAAPDEPLIVRMLLSVLSTANKPGELLAEAEQGLARFPDDSAILVGKARALFALGRVEEAVPVVRASFAGSGGLTESGLTAITPGPDGTGVQLWAMLHNYAPSVTPQQVRLAHEVWARWFNANSGPVGPAPAYRPAEGRPLRIGLVSPDLRRHAVACFVLPLLRHAGAQCEIIAYSTATMEDEVSCVLRSMASKWRHLPRASIDELATNVRNDQVDVLVDLAGHTTGNRLALFKRRAAPVQMTYLGYPSTTGLGHFDARVVDWMTDPAGYELFATEPLARLEGCFVCYEPYEELPPVRAGKAPQEATGNVTFGCFGNIIKINAPLLDLWRRVLDRVPGSRLVLKHVGVADDAAVRSVRQRLADAGIAAERAEVFLGVPSHRAHLEIYGQVDLAFDTFPYCGTTTTFESLAMGVPIITLAGDRHASRVGASILTALGQSDWVADSPDEYVAIAATLARSFVTDEAARKHLRARLLASSLCDGGTFTRQFVDLARALHTRAAPQS